MAWRYRNRRRARLIVTGLEGLFLWLLRNRGWRRQDSAAMRMAENIVDRTIRYLTSAGGFRRHAEDHQIILPLARQADDLGASFRCGRGIEFQLAAELFGALDILG